MSPKSCIVRVPATSANLGPGFDCLGLALDLWNETRFTLTGDQIAIATKGEGRGQFPNDDLNLIAQAALRVYAEAGEAQPAGLQITCSNGIPPSSGLGSSAAAVLTGLLGANALLDEPLSEDELLYLAGEMEGHLDNVAPALCGGLTLAVTEETGILSKKITVHPFRIVIVLPSVSLPTQAARDALPAQVSLPDAVFNVGRTILVVEALRDGDIDLLRTAMNDRLHQPYRLPLIPGAAAALAAAHEAGAAAALSGAGPALIAFTEDEASQVVDEMQAAFSQAGVSSRDWVLSVAKRGASVERNS